MKDSEFLKALIERGENANDGYFQFPHLVACLLSKRLHDSLIQVFNGPVQDGDVLSESRLNELIDLGLCVRVCSEGVSGYTAATYFAETVVKAINAIKSGEIGA